MRMQTQVTFTTDKNGKPLAFRDCRLAGRYIRIGLDEAKLLVATGQAVQVSHRPLKAEVAS